jgi:hypothetical protein
MVSGLAAAARLLGYGDSAEQRSIGARIAFVEADVLVATGLSDPPGRLSEDAWRLERSRLLALT